MNWILPTAFPQLWIFRSLFFFSCLPGIVFPSVGGTAQLPCCGSKQAMLQGRVLLTLLQQLQVWHERCLSICQGRKANVSEMQNCWENHKQVLHLLHTFFFRIKDKEKICWKHQWKAMLYKNINSVNLCHQHLISWKAVAWELLTGNLKLNWNLARTWTNKITFYFLVLMSH